MNNKEIKQTIIEMLDNAKERIQDDDDNLELMAYDLLHINAVQEALQLAGGNCLSGVKDDALLIELLTTFNKLKDYKSPDGNLAIINLEEELDDISYKIEDVVEKGIIDSK